MAKPTVTDKDYQEFFLDEYKIENSRLKSKNANLTAMLERESEKARLVLESPTLAQPPGELETRIALLCASKPVFEEYFTRALRYVGDPAREFFVTILKHDPATGKFSIRCGQYRSWVPVLTEIKDQHGPGLYRVVLNYWNEHRIIKGKTRKPGYQAYYQDITLADQGHAAAADPRGEFTELLDMAHQLVNYHKELIWFQKEIIDLIKTLKQ